MGSLLAFELACALRAQGLPAPRALVVSGGSAPAQRDYLRFRNPLDDEQLVAELRSLQGTPSAVLQHAELMQLTLPILRADFLLCGRYRSQPTAPLDCPLHVFAGVTDRATLEQLQGWSVHTAAGFSLDMFPGGHFFIHEHESAVLERLAACLSASMPARASPVAQFA
jgi:surfactin synthase thioesterase subunit